MVHSVGFIVRIYHDARSTKTLKKLFWVTTRSNIVGKIRYFGISIRFLLQNWWKMCFIKPEHGIEKISRNVVSFL